MSEDRQHSKRPRGSQRYQGRHQPKTAALITAGDFTMAFDELWTKLFSAPAHLDVLIGDWLKPMRAALIQTIQPILLRPGQTARLLKVRLKAGEPWNLSQEKLIQWEAARRMAAAIFEGGPECLRAVRDAVAVDPKSEFPPDMLASFGRDFSDTERERIAAALTELPRLTLRARRELGAEALLTSLREENLASESARLSPLSPLGLILDEHAPVANSSLHRYGQFEIQDAGSQVMAYFSLWPERFQHLLSPRPGQLDSPLAPESIARTLPDIGPLTVVDACAGAGGKTLALSDAMSGKGRLFAYDVSEKRLQALKQRAKRSGLFNIQTVPLKRDAEQDTVKRFRRRADIVLVDAPCGGWGVLRRNPEQKWRFNHPGPDRLPATQQRILNLYSDLVRPGGRLVYGVCTFRPEETTEIVSAFLAEHPDFKAGPSGFLGPYSDGLSDGFFMAAFERT